MGKIRTRRNKGLLKAVKDAITCGDLATVEELITSEKLAQLRTRENGKEYSLLAFACLKSQLEICRFLVNSGASLHGKDNIKYTDYPFHIAAAQGHVGIIKLLISRGGAVQSVLDGLLLRACRSTQPLDYIEYLIDSAANPNVINQYGYSALHFSLFGNHSCQVTRLLLTKAPGIFVNHVDNNKCSALMYAARIKCVNCIGLLLDKEAEVNLVNTFGELAVHFYLENLTRKTPSPEEIRMFRTLLQRTDKLLLRQTILSQEYKCRLLSSILNSKTCVYLDVINEEDFQLSDFLPRDVVSAELLEDISIHFNMTPKPYITICLKALMQRGAFNHPRIYDNLLHPKLHSGIFLGFIQLGFNIPRRLPFQHSFDLTEYDSFMWDPSLEFYEDLPVFASNSLQIVILLRILRIVDDSCLRTKMEKILSRNVSSDPAVQQQTKVAGQLIGKVDSLQSLCRAELRDILYRIHGQKELIPIFQNLGLPLTLINFLLLKTEEISFICP